MHTRFFSLLVIGFVFLAPGLNAQNLTRKFSAGFSLDAGVAAADVKDLFGFTGGMTLRFSYRLGHGFVTFSPGLIGYAAKDLSNINSKAGIQLPLLAGYKHVFGHHFFLMGEMGYSRFRSYYDDLAGKLMYSESGGFTFAPSAGVQFGFMELGARYESFRVDGLTFARESIRLAFNF